jgi:conjugative transfer signal peptidase TraF
MIALFAPPRGWWHWVLGTGLLAAVLGLTIVAPPAPRLVWNASASAPVGLYGVRPRARLARGAMVIAWTPQPWRALAAARRYLPENVPLVKRVAASAGDRICAEGPRIAINGRAAALRVRTDAAGRAMPWWQGCRTLRRDEVFLLMADVPGSFDGRYFGITGKADVIGRAYPLWTR